MCFHVAQNASPKCTTMEVQEPGKNPLLEMKLTSIRDKKNKSNASNYKQEEMLQVSLCNKRILHSADFYFKGERNPTFLHQL